MYWRNVSPDGLGSSRMTWVGVMTKMRALLLTEPDDCWPLDGGLDGTGRG